MMKSFLFGVICFLCTVTSFAQIPTISNGALVIEEPVYFKPGTDILEADAAVPLQKVKAFLDAKPDITLLRVEGHTDNGSAETSNQALSESRALAVCKWLTDKGIDCKRLIAVGFGSTKPEFTNDTPEGKAGNRRMVFKITSLRGRVIGGMPVDGGGNIAGDCCN